MAHRFYSYKLLAVVEGDLDREAEALLRTQMRHQGNKAAEAVEQSMGEVGVHIVVGGVIYDGPA
jgi:hypothetical protein